MTRGDQFVDTNNIDNPYALCTRGRVSSPLDVFVGWDCLGAKKAFSKKQAQWLGFTVLKGAEVDFFIR